MAGGKGEQARTGGLRISYMWHAECSADHIQFVPVILFLGETFGYG